MANDNVLLSSIESTLSERESRYGSFNGHARITQDLKNVMQTNFNWLALTPSQKEALEMVAHKIGRILNGDPNYIDSWHDIAGYVTLVEKELIEKELIEKKAQLKQKETYYERIEQASKPSYSPLRDDTWNSFIV